MARRLAGALGLPYLNTGMMYRALAARAIERGTSVDDAAALLGLLDAMRFGMEGEVTASLIVDGSTPGPELEAPAVEESVSRVARHPAVREAMRDLQRELGARGAVVEGRDIGTVVFPDADLKIFLAADEQSRAQRRERDRADASGVAEALAIRDRRDSRVNALLPAGDAAVIDTGLLDADRTFEAAIALVSQRIGAIER